MDIFLNLFFPFLLTGFIYISLKPLIIYLTKKKIMDMPKKRSNHQIPKPKGAGLIIIPTIIVSIVFLIYFDLINQKPWFLICSLAFILWITSIFDDFYNLPSILRLFIQGLCVLIAIQYFNSEISELSYNFFDMANYRVSQEFLIFIIKSLIFFYWLWLINLFNFMDGMDGITGFQVCTFSMGIIILSIFGSLPSENAYIGIVFFSSFLGFLFWNKPPAKIFLGDSGSIPIGFLISSVIILSLIKQQNFIPIMMLILVHFLDSTLTICVRALNRRNIFEAHSDHFYQKKIRSGLSHEKVLEKINIVNLALLFFSILYLHLGILCLIFSLLLVFKLLHWLNSKNEEYK